MTVSSSSASLRPGVVLSTNRPSAPYLGQVIFESDTGFLMYWNGTQWTGMQPTATTNLRTASYTLVASDIGKMVEMDVSTANNLIVPTNASVPFPIGAQVNILQVGVGQTTIVPSSGVTVNSDGAKLRLRGQWACATLIKRSTNGWVAIGNLVV